MRRRGNFPTWEDYCAHGWHIIGKVHSNCVPKILIEVIQTMLHSQHACHMAKLLMTEYYNEIYSDRHFIVLSRQKKKKISSSNLSEGRSCWTTPLSHTRRRLVFANDMFPKNHLRFRSNLRSETTLLNLAACCPQRCWRTQVQHETS